MTAVFYVVIQAHSLLWRSILSLQGFKVLFQRIISSQPTRWRLQHEAAVTRMQHEQECCAHALQAVEHRRQAAAVQAKAIADEANQRKAARRHGPRAPNQVEPLLCRRRHRPRAPNQSTRDGWD